MVIGSAELDSSFSNGLLHELSPNIIYQTTISRRRSLHARITKSWQGRKPAIIASFGFIVVWVCYLGVNFLGKGLHTYGQML